jgi:signal transduction histidine kinase
MKDTELQKLQDVVIRNAKRLQRLTDDILDVTKIESNLLHLNKEVFNLNDLIFRIIDDDKSQIDNKDIKLIYQDSSNSDDNNIIIVQADKYRLNQVISNLISNSIKFTNKGGTIFITTKREKDNKAIIISIKDTGIGIDPEIMPRLFTRFASKSFQGTGLGLYISKSIIEAHGGRIWATNNTDGKGAIFTFSLPLEKEKSMPKYKN